MNSRPLSVFGAALFLLLLGFITAGVSPVGAELATYQEMANVSRNWVTEVINRHGGWAGRADASPSESHELRHDGVLVARYYDVFPRGYVLVPVLKEMSPVKMYSEESNLGADQEGGVLQMMREVLYQRMEAFRTVYGSYTTVQPTTGQTLLDPTHRVQWDRLAVPAKDFRVDLAQGTEDQGGPLLTCSWHQRAPFSDDCPMGDGGRCAVGCVATATAQILKFWEWPSDGVGYHQYTWDGDNSCGGSTAGGQLFGFFSDDYDWENIPDDCNSGCSPAQSAALAELNYEVGVAHNMDYGACGSGAYTARAAYVFPTFFKYKLTTAVEYRINYTQQGWFDLIRQEIEAGRPIQYRINLHSIVCDGWRDNGQLEFHMNYGWNEGHTTWYVLDNLYCSWVDGDICPYNEEYLIAGIEPQLDPVLEYFGSAVWDPAGNGNGYCEPGESIELTVTIRNAGNDAIGATGVLSESDPYLTITAAGASFDPLIGWGMYSSSQTPFEVLIDPGCPDPYIAVLDIDVSADGGHAMNDSFLLLVSRQPGFEDDFESGEGFWSHSAFTAAYADEWHLETHRFHSESSGWKMGGAGSAYYADNQDAALVTPPLLLPADAKLTFWHWLDAEDDEGGMAWDGGVVMVSENGGAWTVINPEGGYPNVILGSSSSPIGGGNPCYSGSFVWSEAVFDLSDCSGVVQIMFRFGSDGGVSGEGWYVDDVWVGNTLAGSNVAVHPWEGATVTYSSVTEPGITSMDVSDAGPMPPDGHNTVPVGAPEYCELVTSATYDGDIELCLTYDDGDVSSNELRLKLMHHDGSEWVDITSSLDDEANLVCGLATSFSPFLLVEKMSCCQDRVGDANMEGGDKPTIGDVIAMVDMLFVSEVDVPCLAEADVDQSGGLDPVRGDITIGDIIFLIDYLFVTGEGLGLPDCL